MRWEDERYVRLFTRDTPDWAALGWEAQCLFMLLLRKCDRAGIVEMGRSGERGLASMVAMPVDVVARALDVLCEDGCVVRTGPRLVLRSFIEAQECQSSGKLRSEMWRARRESRGPVSSPDATRTDVGVTIGDAASPNATSGDTAQHAVTDGDSEPIRAVPNRTEPKDPAVPAPESRRLPPHVVGHEETFWIAAYERGASAALGHSWVFDRAEFGASGRLGTIVGTFCKDKAKSEEWLDDLVRSFIRQADDRRRERGFGTKQLLEWLNAGGRARADKPRSVLPPLEQPSMTRAETEAAAAAALAAVGVKSFGKGGSVGR